MGFQEFYEKITQNNTESLQISNLVKANVELLNDTLVKTVAYSFVFMENVTELHGIFSQRETWSHSVISFLLDQSNGIHASIDSVTQQLNQVSQLFNTTFELSLFITNILAENITQNTYNRDYPETHIDYEGKSVSFLTKPWITLWNKTLRLFKRTS